MSRFKSVLKPVAAMTIAAALASGCAINPNDPLENYNRVMFSVNEAFDDFIFKPVATAYKFVLPDVVQTGVTNFFGNIADVWTAFNNFLQGEGQKGLSDLTRVSVNSIFGIGGVIDVASELKLTKHHADFGQTLGVWGMESGPYVVLPILGPSTLRDTIFLPVEWYGDPWSYLDTIWLRNAGIVIRAVNYRAALLDTSSLVDDASLNKYEFMRDAYMQRRENQIKSVKNGSGDDWEEINANEPYFKPEPALLNKPIESKDAPAAAPEKKDEAKASK